MNGITQVIPATAGQFKNVFRNMATGMTERSVNLIDEINEQNAVAEATLGRVRDNVRQFVGGTVIGVVYAKKQFSWTLYRNARHAKMWESENLQVKRRWELSLEVAKNSLSGKIPTRHVSMIEQLSRECAHYYKRTDNKGTSARGRSTFDNLSAVRDVGAHTFYKDLRSPCKAR
jgi:stress response protein YsnF